MNGISNKHAIITLLTLILLSGCVGKTTGLSVEPEETVVILFGDSTTAFRENVVVYSEQLIELSKSAGNDYCFFNRGIGGSHTGKRKDNNHHRIRHARDRFQSDVLRLNPDVVVIQFGINDSWIDSNRPEGKSRIPLADYYSNLKYMVEELLKTGVRPILMTPNQIDLPGEEYRHDRLVQYVEAMRKLSVELGVELIDIWSFYNSMEQEKKAQLLLDGVHPGTEGHRIVAREIFNSL